VDQTGKSEGLSSVAFNILFALAAIWIIISLANGKMHRGKIINFTNTFFQGDDRATSFSLSVTALLMFIFRDYDYSRTVVLGTGILATILELLFGAIFIAYKKAVIQDYEDYENYKRYRKPSEYELVSGVNGNGVHHDTHY